AAHPRQHVRGDRAVRARAHARARRRRPDAGLGARARLHRGLSAPGDVMGAAQWLVVAVAALRLLELSYAARNTRRLRARGAREMGASHYPLLFALHAAWLAAIFLTVPPDAHAPPPLAALFD